MSVPKRDCPCMHCIHYPVCTHKETYMSVFKAAGDLIEPYDFIVNIYAVCKYFANTIEYATKAYTIVNAKTGEVKT